MKNRVGFVIDKPKAKEISSVNSYFKDNCVIASIVFVFKIFCRETSFPGIRHLMQSNEECADKRWHKKLTIRMSQIIWTGVCLIGIAVAVIMMNLVWTRFQQHPTITTIDTTNYPIWNVPFPSVTICNINKVYAPNTENITNILMKFGFDIDTILIFYDTLSNLIHADEVPEEFLNISLILEDIGYNTERLMLDLVQPCERMLKTCNWLGNLVPCSRIFKLSKSSQGFCCSFNYRALRESLDVDVDDKFYERNWRVSGAGRFMGLHVLLDIEKDKSMALTKSFYGAEILIHSEEDFPQETMVSAIAQPGFDNILTMNPLIIMTENNLRDVPFEERQCYFEDEIQLRATKKYSLNSCVAECKMDYIVDKCNCLPFLSPDIPMLSNTYRQCDLRDVKCIRNYRAYFSSLKPPDQEETDNSTQGMNCKCYPSCNELSYQITTTVNHRPKYIQSPRYQMDITNLSTIQVYARTFFCIKYRRSPYITWDSLLASFGGILSFCLGGSIMSLIEIFYFCTIKLGLTIYSKYTKKRERPLYGNRTLKARKIYVQPRFVMPKRRKTQQFLW